MCDVNTLKKLKLLISVVLIKTFFSKVYIDLKPIFNFFFILYIVLFSTILQRKIHKYH